MPELVDLILGLLSSIDDFARDLANAQAKGEVARTTIAVFVRSNIYSAVAAAAREPNKLPTTRLQWPDPETLISLLEQRYVAGRSEKVDPGKLWERYFVAQVRGLPTPDYLTHVTFARPRDVIYFARAAIDLAVTRRQGRVEEDDVLKAEHIYSQFAFEAMRVETDIKGTDVEELLLQFAGATPVLEEDQVGKFIAAAGGAGK